MKLYDAELQRKYPYLRENDCITISCDKEMAAFLLDDVFHQLLVDLAGDATSSTDIDAVVKFAEVLVKIQRSIKEYEKTVEGVKDENTGSDD